ncbi:hypothetical protein GUJ93_ZPchr0006g41285 [Zizania palustris]|uniref:Uncharacterized protein n=1 Tax=Zizania palustris TaxID=103762 RepID=A0A8J5VSA6_ZIZPA|nr:hypothetical protein GUJ93_ZPchr0006g41285 [Zizania palustris]
MRRPKDLAVGHAQDLSMLSSGLSCPPHCTGPRRARSTTRLASLRTAPRHAGLSALDLRHPWPSVRPTSTTGVTDRKWSGP